MKKEKISQIINNIDEKYIEEASIFDENSDSNQKSTTKQSNLFKWAILVASIVLMIVVAFSSFAIAAEAKEYNDAVDFFEENGLSIEGLTRTEIKEVYKDITTNSFTYEKTAVVIQKTVQGLEIYQSEPTPEELANFWYNKIGKNSIKSNGISYRISTKYKSDQNTLDISSLELFKDGKLLWSVDFEEFYIQSCTYTENGTMVWGQQIMSHGYNYGYIALIDSNGSVLWKKCLDHSFERETIASVLKYDDTWAVISRAELKYLCLSYYDNNGNQLSFYQTEVGNLGVWDVARFGDGFLVQLGNNMTHDTAHLYKMDNEGNLTEDFSYESDDCIYFIQDMIEYSGQIYISAYFVPKTIGPISGHELSYVIENVGSKIDISSEELTPIVRENYTAVLLVCDSNGGIPQTFYSVKGSLGSNLIVNENQLEWNVKSIISAIYSPFTSSHQIRTFCEVFCYSFNSNGTLIGQIDTGEAVEYSK